MIFWRRREDPETRRILEIAEQAIRSALDRLGARNVKTRVKGGKAEALGEASVGPGEALVVALGELTRALQGAGYNVRGAPDILKVSDEYMRSGSLAGIAIGNLMRRTADTAISRLEVEGPGGMYVIGVQSVKFFGRIGFTVSARKE